jgi:D-serine deaminase-like pyridoxal phosphate-dependent protein
MQVLTSIVGRPAAELDTPALLVDLDILESNIANMAGDIASRGAGWRPHSKANKSPNIAHRELQAGAIGITCAKLGEAEVLVSSGVFDILISNQIVGPIKTRRLAAVNKRAGVDVKVCVDSIENVREIGAAAVALGSRVRVLIEIDSGMQRAGVAPQCALDLAKQIATVDGVELAGVMTWEGHAMGVADPNERASVIASSVQQVVDAANAIRAAGMPVEIVSCGGTGTYLTTSGIEGVTEVQAGGGIWGDAMYLDLGANVQPALTLVAQVISRPTPERVIFDAGRKTVDPSNRAPIPIGLEIAGAIALSAEHGTLHLATPSDTPKVGDRLQFRIGYSDQVVHLHEALFGVRNGIVDEIIPILARGRLQ